MKNYELEAKEVTITEIEAREDAKVEWFPGDWVICRTTAN